MNLPKSGTCDFRESRADLRKVLPTNGWMLELAMAILRMEAAVGLSVAIGTSYMLLPLCFPLLPLTTC